MSSNGSTAISFHENLLFDQTTIAPLTTAAGVDSLLSPITATPIVASPSATALNVTLRTLPNKSLRPLWSSTGSKPAHAISTPVVPIRVGINLLSAITMPTLFQARQEILASTFLQSQKDYVDRVLHSLLEHLICQCRHLELSCHPELQAKSLALLRSLHNQTL